MERLRYTAPMSREPAPGIAADAAVGYTPRMVRSLYPRIRADHLRCLERWGLLAAGGRDRGGEVSYGFSDMAVIRRLDASLERGMSLRAALRELVAAREGQLSLDFRAARGDSQPAKVLSLGGRAPRPDASSQPPSGSSPPPTPAELKFLEASKLDTPSSSDPEAAMAAYRAALELDPELVPALINLGNLHYGGERLVEAQALYLLASFIDPASFEAWFNLGNIHHDRGRLEDAVRCYVEALRWRPSHADAHFYLAVALEKLGRGGQARRHWRAYQELAPGGEWIDLAREFGAE